MQRLASVIESFEDPKCKVEVLQDILDRLEDNTKSRVGGPIIEALISTYASQNLFDDAYKVYKEIKSGVDGPCLRAMLSACSTASPPRWEEALSILHSSDIVADSTGPGRIDQVALGYAIIACSKADEFEEGINLLQLYGESVSAM